MKASIAAAIFAVSLMGTGALAQTAGAPPALGDLMKCRDQADDQARLQCYDAAAAALAAASLVVIDKNEVKRARRGLFGFSLPDLPFLNDDDEEEEEKVREVAGTIQSISRTGYERWLVNLGEAGTWQTIEAQPYVPLPRTGKPAVVKRGPLGNYMMSIDGGRGLRVKRVR